MGRKTMCIIMALAGCSFYSIIEAQSPVKIGGKSKPAAGATDGNSKTPGGLAGKQKSGAIGPGNQDSSGAAPPAYTAKSDSKNSTEREWKLTAQLNSVMSRDQATMLEAMLKPNGCITTKPDTKACATAAQSARAMADSLCKARPSKNDKEDPCPTHWIIQVLDMRSGVNQGGDKLNDVKRSRVFVYEPNFGLSQLTGTRLFGRSTVGMVLIGRNAAVGDASVTLRKLPNKIAEFEKDARKAEESLRSASPDNKDAAQVIFDSAKKSLEDAKRQAAAFTNAVCEWGIAATPDKEAECVKRYQENQEGIFGERATPDSKKAAEERMAKVEDEVNNSFDVSDLGKVRRGPIPFLIPDSVTEKGQFVAAKKKQEAWLTNLIALAGLGKLVAEGAEKKLSMEIARADIYGFSVLDKIPVPSDMWVQAGLVTKEIAETAGAEPEIGSQPTLTFESAGPEVQLLNEGKYHIDFSVGLPLKKIDRLQYAAATASTPGAVSTKDVSYESILALFNIAPWAMDLNDPRTWWKPRLLVGVGLRGRILDRTFFGAGMGLGVGPLAKVPVVRDVQPYAGFQRTVTEGTNGAQGSVAWKLAVGINVPVKSVADRLKKAAQ